MEAKKAEKLAREAVRLNRNIRKSPFRWDWFALVGSMYGLIILLLLLILFGG